MLNNKTVAVVVPAYNEETQIRMVIESMPDFVDRIIIVNDYSSDKMAEVIMQYIADDKTDKGIIKNIHSKERVFNTYDRAEKVLLEQSKKEISLFNPHVVANKNEDTDRIILINHTRNGGVGAAISTGYKWC